MWSMLLSMLSILYDLCRDFHVPGALDCLSIPIGDLALDGEGTASNLARGSLNVPLGLSLINSVFVFTLPAWPMGACAFCLSYPGFLIVGIESISILSLFSVSIGGFGVGFQFFSFSFDLEVNLCLLFVACVSFFGVGFVVSFSVGLSLIFIFFMKSLLEIYGVFWCGWLFHQNLQWLFQQDLCPLGWICRIMGLVQCFLLSLDFSFSLLRVFFFLILVVCHNSSGTVKMCSLIVSFVIIFSISIRFFNSLFSSSSFGFVSSFSSFPFLVTYA